ncbi:hypothetical protein OSH10_06450 [Kaistia defluvii]|uniref:hypothetical protein n=1 Tax=Kaistia defluvii TaxID=410841 RepID=UPI0022585980|nr:hypothetical protein [Kaistia defluvii]MCX5518070.1 hypothetical protein [Kaistia defluvii]
MNEPPVEQHPTPPKDPDKGFEDGREPWEWQTRFGPDAKALINREAFIAGAYLAVGLVATFVCAGLSGQSFKIPLCWDIIFNLEIKLLAIFFTGALGGTTFSIKWLMHSVATGKWHVDRFYWRVFVPMVGGVYAVVVMNLFNGGLIGMGNSSSEAPMGTVTALAFLVGYFSDGVSGLLTNVANAVFGTIEKK